VWDHLGVEQGDCEAAATRVWRRQGQSFGLAAGLNDGVAATRAGEAEQRCVSGEGLAFRPGCGGAIRGGARARACEVPSERSRKGPIGLGTTRARRRRDEGGVWQG